MTAHVLLRHAELTRELIAFPGLLHLGSFVSGNREH